MMHALVRNMVIRPTPSKLTNATRVARVTKHVSKNCVKASDWDNILTSDPAYWSVDGTELDAVCVRLTAG